MTAPECVDPVGEALGQEVERDHRREQDRQNERPDNIPISPERGFLVAVGYAVVPLIIALWLIARSDA